MTIGELAKRTQTSPRSLRHYESRGLLQPARSANGYRCYNEPAIAVVTRIRWLLAAGLGTRSIKGMLHCVIGARPRVVLCPATRAALQAEVDRMDRQLEGLRQSRALLAGILAGKRQRGGKSRG